MNTQSKHLRPAALPAAVAVVALLLASCAGSPGGSYERMADEAPRAASRAPAGAPVLAPEAPAAARSVMKSEAVEEAQPLAASEPDSPAGSTASTAAQEAPQARLRVYSGACRLLVDDPEERKGRIAALAESRGGYVESSNEGAVVVRVPAGQFQEIFTLILGLGEVQHQSVETRDVTDAYNDLSGRLAIAVKTRDRLYLLLEKTTDVNERVKILREIRRLSEEIERMNLTLQMLERQVAFSRISVQLVARLAQAAADRQGVPFRWMADLNPIYPSLGELSGLAELDLGDDFAVFSGGKSYRAESPEGTRVRIGTLPNRPHGDAAFWRQALQVNLGPYYATAEPLEAGAVKAVLFTSKDRTPYHYLVGVIAAGQDLHVVEVFLPDELARTRRLAAVVRALEKLEIRQ